jgi:hypothetical protein
VRAATFHQPRRKPMKITAAIRSAPEPPIPEPGDYQTGRPFDTGLERADAERFERSAPGAGNVRWEHAPIPNQGAT